MAIQWISPNRKFQVVVEDDANEYLHQVADAPFIEISVVKKGCSGKSYHVETRAQYDDRHYVVPLSSKLALIVDRILAEDVFQELKCRLVQQSHGQIIEWAHAHAQKVCGCGESFL